MYRMFMYPNLLSENTGTNEKPVWQYKSTVSDEVKEGVQELLKIYDQENFGTIFR